MLPKRARPPLPEPPYVVAGLGRAGVAATSALLEHVDASAVQVWDGADVPQREDAVAGLRRRGVRVVLGTDGTVLLEAGTRPRTVVTSPGLPDDLPLLRTARRLGLAVVDEAEVGWRIDPRPWIGITGTNGKSTSARLVASVLRAQGVKPVLGGNTHGAPPLSALDPDGDVVVAEISSFQLERTDHLVPEAALLTQVGTDHLDRHGTRDRYGAVKERLFLRGTVNTPVAAIGIDDRFGRAIAERLRLRDARVVTFGLSDDADVQGCPLEWDLDGGTVEVRSRGETSIVHARLPGPHNAANIAGVIALAQALGIETSSVVEAITAAPPPPGRMAHLDIHSAGDVVFDFAKNADGVARALETVQRVVRQRGTKVVVVLSAMPVADPAGLFAMGAAGGGADRLVLTVDRWSADVPPEPHPELVRGARSTAREMDVVLDRREALAHGLALLDAGDVLVVLGRTPAPMPSVGADGSTVRFDDVAELRALAATC